MEQHFTNTKCDRIGETLAADFSQSQTALGIGAEQCRRRIEELRACWKWAIERKLAKNNPWIEPYRKIKVQPKQAPKPLSSLEIQAILTTAKSDKSLHIYSDYIEFLVGSGVRLGEAAGLQWQNVSDDCRVCWIGQCVTRGQRRPAKSNKSREIKLSEHLTTLLLNRRPSKVDPKAAVFTSPDSCPIDDGNFRDRVWKPLLKRLAIPYRPPKVMRQTFVSHALQLGLSPVQVSALTGHSTRVLHEHYAGLIGSSPELPNIV